MRKNVAAISSLLVILLTAAVSSAQTDAVPPVPNNPAVSVSTADKSVYPLGVGDELEIKVLGEPQFDGLYTINGDGRFQLPFVEEPIMAACRTDRELRVEMTKLLKRYLRDPQVNVRVTARNSRPPVTIYGEVRAPQQFDMRRQVSLLELISYAGGVNPDSSSGVVQVLHTRPPTCGEITTASSEAGDFADNLTTQQLEAYKLSDLRDGKKNVVVRPGDVIEVVKSLPVYMVGEVRAPQGLYIPDRGLTLTDAVAKVGGVNEQAKKKDVHIYRKKPTGEPEMISANLDLIKKGQQKDILLQPYDVVEVDKAKDSFAVAALKIAAGTGRQAVSTLGTGGVTRILY